MKNTGLSVKLAPRLFVTPQLKQALRILQLPVTALGTYLKQEISENPLLQPLDSGEFENTIKSFLSAPAGGHSQKNSLPQNDNAESQIISSENTPALKDCLLHQARMTFTAANELLIAEEIIGHVDDYGYLRVPLEKIADNIAMPPDNTAKVLKIIQAFEPSGVGARNLQECLLIQLANKEKENTLAYAIVQSCFKELARKNYPGISRKLNAKIEEIKNAVAQIASLNPRPGETFSIEKPAVTIKPDIFVSLHKNLLKVTFNERDLPLLKINPGYKKLLENTETPEEIKQFVHKQLKNALWLIKALEQRKINTAKAVKSIVAIQKQAIANGLSCVKSLALKDIAQNTGLHLSTVARIVSGKYISTPQGTIPLKNLFSSKLKTVDDKSISARQVLGKLQKLIRGEDKKKPSSDKALAEILNNNGIKISRRTIAKYRNLLKIPPAFLRMENISRH